MNSKNGYTTRFVVRGSERMVSTNIAELKAAVATMSAVLKSEPLPKNALEQLTGHLDKLSDLINVLPDRRSETGEETIRDPHLLKYQSGLMAQVVQGAIRAAAYEMPILITGETGVGKEMIARLVHINSQCSEGPLVPFNCAAVTKELFESILFGYKQGTFTGASRDRKGIISASSGGTLILDEIGELPLDLQPKLLRFLDCGEIHPIGDTYPTRVKVRIIGLTNRCLESEVSAGRFRSDLFYRLNNLNIRVPPLRQRRDDIPLLLEHYCGKIAAAFGHPDMVLSPELVRHLSSYDWPGNVRELINLVYRLLVQGITDRPILMKDLPAEFLRPQNEVNNKNAVRNGASSWSNYPIETRMTLAEEVERLEREKVYNALVDSDWNYAKAAHRLGLSTFGLRKKYHRLFTPGQETLPQPERQP